MDEYSDYGVSPSYLQPTAKETLRQSWLASKPTRQFWWYWCIGPADPKAMNTFVERPAIEARLRALLTVAPRFAWNLDHETFTRVIIITRPHWLQCRCVMLQPGLTVRCLRCCAVYWLTALHAVNGMLYVRALSKSAPPPPPPPPLRRRTQRPARAGQPMEIMNCCIIVRRDRDQPLCIISSMCVYHDDVFGARSTMWRSGRTTAQRTDLASQWAASTTLG